MSLRSYITTTDRTSWELDTITAVVGLVLTALLLPLYFYTTTVFTLMIPIAIGVGSGLYLVTRQYSYEGAAVDRLRTSRRAGHVLRMATFVGMAGMVFLATLTGGRTVPFYGVAIVTYLLVFAQIAFLQRPELSPALVLAEILGFAVILRAAALLTTPGLIGVDVWVHIPNYAASIRDAGGLWAIDHTKYFGAPLYHLLVVVGAEAFDSTLRTGLYATLGIVMPISILLIYYTTVRFLPVRWALFAAAAFAIADRTVLWSVHLIPTSMGLVFFLGVFYGVARIYTTERSRMLYALVLLFALGTVLTHQISTFVLLVFLGAGTLVQLSVKFLGPRLAVGPLRDDRNRVNFAALLAVVLPITLVDWSISPAEGPSFLGGMAQKALIRLQTPSLLGSEAAGVVNLDPIAAYLTSIPLYVRVIYSLGLTVLLLVGLIGAFVLLRRDHLDSLSLTWLVSVAVMLFVALGMPLLGLTFLIPSRWLAFAFVPLIVMAVHGFRHFEATVGPRQFMAFVVVFALLFTGPMLIDHKATIEEPVFDGAQFTPAYSESEIEAAQTIATLHPDETRIHADRPYFLLLRDWQQLRGNALTLTKDGTVADDYVVYRTELSEGGPTVAYQGVGVRVELPYDAVCRPSMDVVYSNGNVRYCQAAS